MFSPVGLEQWLALLLSFALAQLPKFYVITEGVVIVP
jgi:hypothetical protein